MYASKGPVVEEWADRRFFRPIGWRLARALVPTRVTPDAVTLASLVVGLVAGHLFWYASAWINAAGVLLFVASDVLDSADGQLARLRGTSTRTGRILDGVSERRINQMFEVTGKEHLDEAIAQGRGCIVLTSHLDLRFAPSAVLDLDAQPGVV